ncbi:MAG: hypothetical protein ABWY06_17015 [Pseudomonas sp.]|uniref:hypothetical protein n=1 Tax=Pseudomonas sp. TaxID=306 RepID=UPI0033975178
MTTGALNARIRLALLALIALAALAAVLLWVGSSSEELRVVRPAMQALPGEADIAAGRGTELSAALQRPLFWDGRVPIASSALAPPAAQAEAKIEGFKLLGIVMDRDKSTALLATPQGVKRATVDDQIQGWTVRLVTQTEVVLSSGEKHVELSVIPKRHPGIKLGPVDGKP